MNPFASPHKFESNMDLLTSEIFDLKPTKCDQEDVTRFVSSYIQSSEIDLRRYPFMVQKQSKSPTYQSIDLNDFIDGYLELGPYERHTIAKFLIGKSNMVVIVGGTGSGKTSSLRFACEFIKKQKGDRKIIILNIDFYGEKVFDIPESTDSTFTEEEQKKEIIKLLEKNIWSQYVQYISDEDMLSSFWDLVEERNMGALRILDRCKSKGKKINGIESVDLAASLIRDTIDILKNEGELTKFVFSLIEAQQKKNQMNDIKPIFIIDNMDPQPGYLQSKILQFLIPIASTSRIRVFVAVRLSTFEDVLHPWTFKWYFHSGPLPIDIVFVRLLHFLLNPECYKSYSCINDIGLKGQVYARCLSFWLRLLDPHDEFSIVFESCVGNNIRNAYDLAKMWLCHDNLRTWEHDKTMPIKEYQKILADLISIHILSESSKLCGVQLKEEIKRKEWALQNNNKSKEEVDKKMANDLGLKLCERFSHTWQSVIKRFTSKTGLGKENEIFIQNILNSVPGAISKLSKRMNDPEVLCDLSMATLNARNIALKTNRKETFSNQIFENISQHLRKTMGKIAPEINGGIIKHISEWTIQRMEIGMKLPIDKKKILVRQGDRWNLVSGFSFSKKIRILFEVNNRYESAKALIVPPDDENYNRVFCCNVFECDGKIKPIGLRILYLLAQRELKRMKAKELVEKVMRHDYLEEEVVNCINKMISRDHRLIWLEKYSYYQSINDVIGDQQRVVHLSSTGIRYFCDLVYQPSYIQNMLKKVQVVNHIDLIGIDSQYSYITAFNKRIWNVFEKMQYLVSFEFEKIQKCFREFKGKRSEFLEEELECQNASADVVLKSFELFFRAIWAHYKNVQDESNGKNKDELIEIKRMVEYWMEFGKKIINDHRRMFEGINVEWSKRWLYAGRYLERKGLIRADWAD